MTLDLILESTKAKKCASGWLGRCPAHEDKKPSLSISEKDGKILLKCHAGCETSDILAALGLDYKDLFSDNGQKSRNEPLSTYDYTTIKGDLLYQVCRFPGKRFVQRRPDAAGGWIYNLKDTTRVPYNLPSVLKAIKAGETIYIVEGEKDCQALAKIGLTATTNSGGCGSWTDSLSAYFKGADVAILPDNDEPGRSHAQDVASKLSGIAKSIKIVELPDLKEKQDISDWLKKGNTKEDLLTLVEKTLTFKKTDKPATCDNTNVNVNVNSIASVNNVQFVKLDSIPLTEINYLVEDFLVDGVLSMVYGDGGVGKSYFALLLGVLVALGRSLLDRTVVPGRVLYIDYELSAELQRQRLERILRGLGVGSVDNLFYLSPGVDGESPNNLMDLIPIIKEDNFDLIIIDSMGAALIGDPEAAKDICSLFQQLRQLGTVLLLDHQSKKQKGDKSRDKTPFGSAYKYNLTRNIWHLNSQQEGDYRLNCLLRHTKSNLTSKKPDLGITFNFENGALLVSSYEPGLEFGEHLTLKQKILLALNELEATAETIAETTGEDLASIKAKISLLKKQGIVSDTGRKQGRALIYELTNVNECNTRNVNVNVRQNTSSEQVDKKPDKSTVNVQDRLTFEETKKLIINEFDATEVSNDELF